MTNTESRIGRLRRHYREAQPFLEASRRRMFLLSAASVAAGFVEAAALLSLVQLALAISEQSSAVALPAGPFGDLEISIAGMILLSAALALARLGLQIVIAYLPARMSTDAQANLRRQVFDSFLKTTWEVQSREREGQLQEVMVGQVNRSSAAVQVLADAITAAFNFLALIISAIVLSPTAAGAIAVAVVVLFFLFRPLTARARLIGAQRSSAYVGVAETISESVRMAEEVQVFGVADAQRAIVDQQVERLSGPLFRAQFLSRLQTGLYHGVSLLLLVAGLGAVYLTGTSDVGAIGAVVLIMVRGLTYSQSLQNAYHRMNDLAPDMALVRRHLELYQKHERRAGSTAVPEHMDLVFDDVNFEYRRGVPVLKSVSFTLHHGSAVGVLGPSGAGKSTVVQLLLRLRLPTSGRLSVNGSDAEEFSLDDWRQRVTYVPQDGRLIQGTVAENIAFHRTVSHDEVESAAKLAGIHDEIVRWPEGYDTPVGQRADAVSGGQRQRLTIARALALRPSLLILDEPTSALDLDAEAIVQETLERLKGTVTIVTIAHRLSTLKSCDELMVFEGGELSASGAASDLLRSSEFYRRAVELSQLR